MTSYRCIVILLAFLFCLSSAAPINFSIDNLSGIDKSLSPSISNENTSSQQNSITIWSTTERASILFNDFFQKYTSSWSKAAQASHSSNPRRRIARRRHP